MIITHGLYQVTLNTLRAAAKWAGMDEYGIDPSTADQRTIIDRAVKMGFTTVETQHGFTKFGRA